MPLKALSKLNPAVMYWSVCRSPHVHASCNRCRVRKYPPRAKSLWKRLPRAGHGSWGDTVSIYEALCPVSTPSGEHLSDPYAYARLHVFCSMRALLMCCVHIPALNDDVECSALLGPSKHCTVTLLLAFSTHPGCFSFFLIYEDIHGVNARSFCRQSSSSRNGHLV